MLPSPYKPAMTRGLTASSSAARARRYRQRQREEYVVVQVPVHDESIDALVQHCFLDEAGADDREKIAEAIDLLLSALAYGATEVDYAKYE